MPTFVSHGLEYLRKKFPNDIFKEIVGINGLVHIKCDDCPERLFKFRYNTHDVSSFENHLLGAKHIENVHDRVLRGGLPLKVTPAVKSRAAKLKTTASALAIWRKLSSSFLYQIINTQPKSPIMFSTLEPRASKKDARRPPKPEEREIASFADTSSMPKSANPEEDPQELAKSLSPAPAAPTARSGIEALSEAPKPIGKFRDFHQYTSRVVLLQRQYPDDLLQLVDVQGALHVKCHDCQDQLIKVPALAMANVEQHIRGVRHIENVFNRVRDGGKYLKETPEVKARVEALKTRTGKFGLYLRLTSVPYENCSGSSGPSSSMSRASPSTRAYSESPNLESEGNLVKQPKEAEGPRQTSLSNVDLRASPIVPPEDGSFEQKLPDFVSPALAQLRIKFPDELFELDINNPGMLLRTKCNDCPGQYFEISARDRSLSNLKSHLLGSKHVSNVHKRMSEHGKPYNITSDVTNRMEKLRRQYTTAALYHDLIKTGAPRGHRSPDLAQSSASSSIGSVRPTIPSSVSPDPASPSSVQSSAYKIQSEPLSYPSKPPAKRTASASIENDIASKKVCTGLGDNPSQAATRTQAEASTTAPASKENSKDGYFPILQKCVTTLEIHNCNFSDHSQKLKEPGAQVQQTMQMLGDIFDTGAAQNTAIERMRTDTTEWIKDLDLENKKQKTTIDRLRLDVRQQKDIHTEFVKSTEARFERMAQDHKAQLGLVMDLIKSGNKAKVANELGIPQPARPSPRELAHS